MSSLQKPRNALAHRRLLERLQLLCGCGAGLPAIAALACAIARDLVGADSGSIFWLDPSGAPAGFFHDCATAELKDFFVTHFDELFSAPGQFNMVTFTQMVGPPVGRMLDEGVQNLFLASNVFRYLAAPLGHHYPFDIRIEHDGRCAALLVLWNREGRPFSQRDVVAAQPVRALLEQSLRAERQDATWRPQASRTSHFITDLSGDLLLAIDAEAEDVLSRCQLLRQNVPIASSPRQAPAFARGLAAMLAQGAPARLMLPVADGRLVALASLSRRIGEGGRDELQMFVSVDLEVSVSVLAVEHLSALPLTLMQKQIALFAAQGGLRADCEDHFGVSDEALKKHLRTIYDVTGAPNWAGLRDRFWTELLAPRPPAVEWV